MPSTTKLSGTPDEPSAIWTALCAIGADPLVRVAVRGEERGDVLGPVADRDAVDRHALRLSCCSTGASAMHGTHQLAKILTRRGWPVARSADVSVGFAGKRRRQVERRHRLALEP